MKNGKQKAEGTRRCWSSALLVALAGAMGSSAAQPQIMTDPTRPPVGIFADAPDATAPGNQLQSVMISPTRRAAIINGVVVELGAKYGDAVLMQVAEDEVVLRSGDSRQVLKLHPAVEKQDVARARPVAPAAAKSAPREAKAKREAGREAAPNAKSGAREPGATADRNTGAR
jgi:MSHA biogenesis protein MshK